MKSTEIKLLKIVLNHKIKIKIKTKLNSAGFKQVGDDHMFMFIDLTNKIYIMDERISEYTKSHYEEISYLKLLLLLDKLYNDKLEPCRYCGALMSIHNSGLTVTHPGYIKDKNCILSGYNFHYKDWPKIDRTLKESVDVETPALESLGIDPVEVWSTISEEAVYFTVDCIDNKQGIGMYWKYRPNNSSGRYWMYSGDGCMAQYTRVINIKGKVDWKKCIWKRPVQKGEIK